ncbi:hypothetical protein ACFL2Q_07250 [Thermodesulfobacteriota bacterium]
MARKLDAKKFVKDFRQGMDQSALMAKYDLSSGQYEKVLQKLAKAGISVPGRVESPPPVSREHAHQAPFNCPKCGFRGTAESDECPKCGIIASKVDRGGHGVPLPVPPPAMHSPPPGGAADYPGPPGSGATVYCRHCGRLIDANLSRCNFCGGWTGVETGPVPVPGRAFGSLSIGGPLRTMLLVELILWATVILFCFAELLMLVEIIFFIIWAYKVAEDMPRFAYEFPITPGGALARILIPFYNLWGIGNLFNTIGKQIEQWGIHHRVPEVRDNGASVQKWVIYFYIALVVTWLLQIIALVVGFAMGSSSGEPNTGAMILIYITSWVSILLATAARYQWVKKTHGALETIAANMSQQVTDTGRPATGDPGS